jgi:hypothetical protein
VDQITAVFLSIVGLLGSIFAIFYYLKKIVKPVWCKVRNLIDVMDDFSKDWNGEPAKPGRDAVPGVMERLNRIDGELQHNSGSSMKDALKRVETKLTRIDERLVEGNKRFERIEQRLDI